MREGSQQEQARSPFDAPPGILRLDVPLPDDLGHDRTMFVIRMGGVTCWGTMDDSLIFTASFEDMCVRFFQPAWENIKYTRVTRAEINRARREAAMQQPEAEA